MNYRHLTDSELIHYAQLDAPSDSLTALLAARFGDNVTCVADLESTHASELENLERSQTEELQKLQTESDIKDARIVVLEHELDEKERELDEMLLL